MSIGLKSGTVILQPHQDEWDIEGKRICASIKEILGKDVIDVQHVGSTSIKGICAKPNGIVPPHITLAFPFDSDISNEDLKCKLSEVACDFKPFKIKLKGTSFYLLSLLVKTKNQT